MVDMAGDFGELLLTTVHRTNTILRFEIHSVFVFSNPNRVSADHPFFFFPPLHSDITFEPRLSGPTVWPCSTAEGLRSFL